MTHVNGNGNGLLVQNSNDIDTSSIIQVLELIHSPATPNDRRLEALGHLEHLKQRNDAAEVGFSLSVNTENLPMVRHFGLSLLDDVIRHKLHHLSESQSTQFREMVLSFATTLEKTPQLFIRNKIAALWIELSKRTWALDWYDLDEHLVRLWSQSAVAKEFALSVLENLSADVFEREDGTAILRGKDLNGAVVEIFSSTATFTGGVKVGDVVHPVRYGDDGWLSRITHFVHQILQDGSIKSTAKNTAIAALATLRSAFTWATTPPIVNAQCLPVVCMCLTVEDTDVILGAIDALNALYGRTRMDDVEVQALVLPLCQPDSVAKLEQVYTWSVVTFDDLDSPKYTISKKMSELVNHLTDWAAHFNPPTDIDLGAFLKLVVHIAQHDSLIVSIPAVHCWDIIMQSKSWRRTDVVQSCIQPVLQFATQRVIQYDQIPDNVQEAAVLFVNEEIELHPDRQAFFITYRRFCLSIIDWVAYTFLDQALDYLLSQVDQTIARILADQTGFDLAQYNRSSVALLQVDAQFSIVDAAFRGITRWISTHKDEQSAQQVRQLTERMRLWSTTVLSERVFKDPLMMQRQIKHAVETSNKILTADTDFAFKVLEHTLSSFAPLRPEYPTFSESMAELHSYASGELRRLALEHASYFVTFYDQLEAKFSELTASNNVDEKVQIDLRSTLFLVVQRAKGVDPSLRQARLQTFLSPIGNTWSQNQSLVASFETFTHSQAFDRVGPYMASCRAGAQADWSNVTFGEDGVQVQKAMASGAAHLPLRETRVLLSVSTERLEQDSDTHKMICQLWAPMLPVILSNVLRIVNYSHRLHDTANWPNVTPDNRDSVQRVMRDRYWQSGISEGSMNDFHRKVKSTKSTMEGFASSVRGRIRTNLENCYSIIHTSGRLGSHFYSMPEIPESISQDLLQTASPLGLHHFGTLLSMLPKLIEECPAADRQNFLTPVLATLLHVMDTKCTNEWQKLEQRKEGAKQDDNLSDEMREESVLRQMTYRAVNMVAFWLDPQREVKLNASSRVLNGTQEIMRDFILSNIRVLEPLLVFCTHAMAYKDTKACATMAAALQKLVPVFASDTHLQGQEAMAVREYISSEMMKSLITSLHDGYFADYQNQLGTLIAMIWTAYGLPAHIPATEQQPAHDRPAWTDTPRSIILSIPGMDASSVDATGKRLAAEGLHGRGRKLRSELLKLLEDLKGVRLSEMGKIDTRVQHSKILEKYKAREAAAMQGIGGEQRPADDSIDLGGIADMFGS